MIVAMVTIISAYWPLILVLGFKSSNVISLEGVELEKNLDDGASLGFRVCQIIFKNVLLSK